jgi:hypothetical protein
MQGTGAVRRIVIEVVPLLAALAAAALLLDEDAALAVSTAVAVVWGLWMIVSPGPRTGRLERLSWPQLLVRLLPVFVAGVIAEAFVSARWFPFTFAALAFALLIPWMAVVNAWERRRAVRKDP